MDHGTGARIQAAREQRGATPEEVAAAVGIPPEAVTDIEAGDAVRCYGPALAAAWTWAVGRHVGVAIDHELATWQPPRSAEEPATASQPAEAPATASQPGEEPATASQPGEADEADQAQQNRQPSAHNASNDSPGQGEPSIAPPEGSVASPSREPTIQPGWLADFDDDPLEDFDPAAADRLPGPFPGDRAAPAASGSDLATEAPQEPEDDHPDLTATQANAAGPRPEPDNAAPARPEADDAGGAWVLTGDELSSEAPDQGSAPAADVGGTQDAGGAPPGETEATSQSLRRRAGEDTGELPSSSEASRVLAYTEGEDVPRLGTRSRLRSGVILLAALVVLVGAGVAVGALAAQLLDNPVQPLPDSDAEGQPEGDGAVDATSPAGDADDQPGDGPAPDETAGDANAANQPDGPADQLGGDAAAAAAPADTVVQLLNGSGDEEGYAEARATLQDLGYQVIDYGRAASTYEQTTVLVTDGFADEAAALVQRDARFGNLQPNDGRLSQDVELHVIVGKQWTGSTDG